MVLLTLFEFDVYRMLYNESLDLKGQVLPS